MATRAPPTTQPAQLCDYCHQKAKFGTHQFCSKTCAGQAAATPLCNQCQKKPKFTNFDYCGKACAALAGASKPKNVAAQSAATGANTGSYPRGSNFNQKAQTNNNNALDPLQIAKLVVQHIPQVQAMLAPMQTTSQAPIVQAPGIGTTSQIQPQLQQAAAISTNNAGFPPVMGSNNPFANLGTQSTPLAVATGSSSVASAAVGATNTQMQTLASDQSDADDTECLIPGCGKPVHVDAKGLKTSDYCSMRHREEAVTMGLASPCIMCLALPQSGSDYFCSRACREEALNKEGDT